jgi:hypothetical protein
MSRRGTLWVLAIVVALALIGVAVADFSPLEHWLSFHTGTTAVHPNPVYYNFWSGFGSDLGEATLITTVGLGVYTGIRKANCHTKGCWRIGHHPLEGTPYHLCAHHHPDVPNGGASHAEILEHFRIAKAKAEARAAALVEHRSPPAT